MTFTGLNDWNLRFLVGQLTTLFPVQSNMATETQAQGSSRGTQLWFQSHHSCARVAIRAHPQPREESTTIVLR